MVRSPSRVLGAPCAAHVLPVRSSYAPCAERCGKLESQYTVRGRLAPPDHPEMLETIGRLATIYYEAGDNAKAEPLFEEAIARHSQVLGEGHWRTLTYRANYASLLAETGRLDRALSEWSACIEGLSSSLGAEHPITVEIIAMRDDALGKEE